MSKLAAPALPARKAPRPSELGPWIGRGRALASEIWGINYVGTIPSHGVPITDVPGISSELNPSQGILSVVVGAGNPTPAVWPPITEDLYWNAFRPTTSDIAVTVWGGTYVISLPYPTVSAPDLAFWAREGIGASSVLFVGEAKLTHTDPTDARHAPAWRRLFEPRSLSEEEPAPSIRDPHKELRALAESTLLPVEQLGDVLGASRRTMYNWLGGRPIRDEARSRIFRLRDSLEPVIRTRDPALVRNWLVHGDPSPALLAAEDQWDEFDDRVRQATAVLRPINEGRDSGRDEPHPEPLDVLRAALMAFSTPQAQATSQRPGWRPREVTGIASDVEEDAE
jgi:hypothetical protein